MADSKCMYSDCSGCDAATETTATTPVTTTSGKSEVLRNLLDAQFPNAQYELRPKDCETYKIK